MDENMLKLFAKEVSALGRFASALCWWIAFASLGELVCASSIVFLLPRDANGGTKDGYNYIDTICKRSFCLGRFLLALRWGRTSVRLGELVRTSSIDHVTAKRVQHGV